MTGTGTRSLPRAVPARWRAWWLAQLPTGRRLPAVDVRIGRAVPGWALRTAFPFAVGALVLATGARTALIPALSGTIVAVLVGWAAIRPGPGPAHVALVVAALELLGASGAPFDPAVLWLAPLAYGVTRLGWWASHVGARDRVELAALRRTLVRDVVVVLVALLVGAAGQVLAGRPVPWLVALGVAGLAALAWIAVRRDDGEAR